MPNHCSNRLTITGKEEDLVRFMKSVKTESEETDGGSLLDFNKIYPMPEDPVDQLKETPEAALFRITPDESLLESYQRLRKSSNPEDQKKADNLLREAWYYWRTENWGTKWNSYDCEMDVSQLSQGTLVYDFWTAWAPPDGVIKMAARKFPELTFRLDFAEAGCDFSGVTTAHGEEVVDEDYDDVHGTEYGRALFAEEE